MKTIVRAAGLMDATAIARVQVDTWRTTYRGIVPQSFLDAMDPEIGAEAWRERIAGGNNRIFVAVSDDVVNGFVSGGRLREPLAEFDGEIGAIYVVAAAQRLGLGRAMMREVAAGLEQDGMTSAAVWVLEQNPACGFYERLGGERVGRKMIEVGGAELEEVAYGWRDLRSLTKEYRS